MVGNKIVSQKIEGDRLFHMLSNRVHVMDSLLDFGRLDVNAVDDGVGMRSYVYDAIHGKADAYFLYQTNMRLGNMGVGIAGKGGVGEDCHV